MDRTTADLHLTIETGSDPIAGSISAPGEEPHRFNGWIELVAAIERARSTLGISQEPRLSLSRIA